MIEIFQRFLHKSILIFYFSVETRAITHKTCLLTIDEGNDEDDDSDSDGGGVGRVDGTSQQQEHK